MPEALRPVKQGLVQRTLAPIQALSYGICCLGQRLIMRRTRATDTALLVLAKIERLADFVGVQLALTTLRAVSGLK